MELTVEQIRIRAAGLTPGEANALGARVGDLLGQRLTQLKQLPHRPSTALTATVARRPGEAIEPLAVRVVDAITAQL